MTIINQEKMTLQTDNEMIYGLVNPIVIYINSFITRLVPEMQIPFVIAVSLLAAYWIKHKNNWSNYSFAGMAVIIFAGLRYIEIGGA